MIWSGGRYSVEYGVCCGMVYCMVYGTVWVMVSYGIVWCAVWYDVCMAWHDV